MIEQHQWTHTGEKVWFVRCNSTGHNGFVWPRSGTTICPKAAVDRQAAMQPTCESGGLFGWPWGFCLGVGKDVDYRADWIVFAANPEDVIGIHGKAKAIGEVE